MKGTSGRIGSQRLSSHRLNSHRLTARASATLLASAVMAFQFASNALLMFRTNPLDMQALYLALGLPLLTITLMVILPWALNVDRILLLLTLFLIGLGLTLMQDVRPTAVPFHAQNCAIGLIAMMITAAFVRHMRLWRRFEWVFMGLAVACVALPLVLGRVTNGAYNWVYFAGYSFQPSEAGKLLIILFFASAMSRGRGMLRLVPSVAVIGLCCVLLIIERDMGALMLYFLLALVMFYAGTSNGWLTLVGIGAASAGSYWSYQYIDIVKTRVEIWKNPFADPTKLGYQPIQALIAIGSGGALGMGLGLGYPRLIPAYHTDFIFAVICEQMGYLFALCVVAVYVLLVMRGMSYAMNARRRFYALVALGASTLIGIQTFIIIGGVIRLIPLTGVTMPFVSYGGSSMISCCAIVGLILGVSAIHAGDEQHDVFVAETEGGGAV